MAPLGDGSSLEVSRTLEINLWDAELCLIHDNLFLFDHVALKDDQYLHQTEWFISQTTAYIAYFLTFFLHKLHLDLQTFVINILFFWK